MPHRRGISTVLGALLFTVVAILLIALALRIFTESAATLTELASVVVQRSTEERLAISVSYKQARKLTASEASASVIIQPSGISVDTSLLNELDGYYVAIESQPLYVANSSDFKVAVAHAVELEVNLARSGNCTLTVALNSTGFVEVYVPAGQAWVLASRYYVKAAYAWFNVTFSGDRALVYAYSLHPFKLMLDYLEVEVPELAPDVSVTVVNAGTEPVNLYAVWLNAMRESARQVLPPGDHLTVTFRGVQLDNLATLEVRAVTSTRVHIARFPIERLPTPQPMPRFSIVYWDQSVTGSAGSLQKFTATIRNVGSEAGGAVLEVRDHTGSIAGSVNLTLQPGEETRVEVTITLPDTSGSYVWTVRVVNSATGRVDDSKSFAVIVTALAPIFSIVQWNQSIAGPAGSSQRFVVTVRNTGGSMGDVEIEVRDHTGIVVNSTQLTVPPGGQATATLTITLPSTMGAYTWTVVAINAATGEVDDAKDFAVTVQQPKFSIVSWSQVVSGPVGSKQKFAAVIENVGNGEGVVRVEVRDHAGTLVNSTTLALPAGGQSAVELTVPLPLSRGVYTWTVAAVNTATGEVDDSKSFTVYAMDLYLNVRGAICYTPFESLPPGWGSIGGSWSIVSGGVEGNALQGVDNNGGPGGTSVFYWATGIAAYSSLQAVVQVRITSIDNVYRGIVLLQDTTSTSPLYEVSARPRRVGANNRITLYLRRFSGGRWSALTSQNAAYATGWYTLYVSWIRSGTTNTLSAVLYDSSGNQVASVAANDAQVAVNYFGLDVDGGTGLFDNFVLAASDPRYVVVSGLQQGWSVELRDAGGVLVANAIADSSGVAKLFVVAKPIVLNARIAVKDSLGNVVVEKGFNMVVGGDEYAYGP